MVKLSLYRIGVWLDGADSSLIFIAKATVFSRMMIINHHA